MSTEEKNSINNDLESIRKNKGLSISEVSNKLKLTTETISKLEEGNFKDLGAYIYVRGYMQHYTDLLEVDSEKYLNLIPKNEMKVPLVNTRANNAKKIKFQRQSKNFMSYALGTFIVVAISFSGWFLLKNYQGINKSNNTNLEMVESNSLEITPQQNTDTESQNETNDDQYHLSSLIPTTEVKTNPDVLDSNFTESETIIEGSNEQDSSNEIIRTTETIVDLRYEILITAKQTSWVKVEQLDGVKLHNDLLQPGNITLKSDEPIHFRIGNTNNVSVSINGDVVDLSKFSRKNIADFNWPIDS